MALLSQCSCRARTGLPRGPSRASRADGARIAAMPGIVVRSSSRAPSKRLLELRLHGLTGAIIQALMHRIPSELHS